ncbi:GNAT family N-acetyltransferase [Bacillus sp. S/N-304-OC-R1]|uniref:GNAT family N-acetyltransferase n=1 Tax=Bacillus sp. S/N-304-OC-R1 TaxID=2758034 RepID=UPI001C8E5847|nr:GNAT family N-acetyltransferase [Bacillus sp. S/N-304-OC-R1]MBY0122009.1 GNAT family N-acetyltransferase [Bacillus sp. S/N-304-OC-R1]
MIDVRKIEPEHTYNLRHRVLRPHQSLEDCMYETDYETGAFHVGAFYDENLISIASFCTEKNPDFPVDKQYHLRGMATLEGYRKLGAGRAIVDYAESLMKEHGYEFLWCKGRTSVQDYYSKLGFKVYGEVFDYPPIGPHIIMYKHLPSI